MLRWIIVFCSFLGLIFVRGLEDQIFYDPFLDYFKSADHNALFPNFVWGKLVLSYLFRFGLNLLFSLLIIHFIFQNLEWSKQSFYLILLVFVIVFPLYLWCISNRFQVGYLFSFYLRRFVIQPLTLLLLIAIFYYRKKINSQILNNYI